MLMQGRKAIQLGALGQAELLYLSILKSRPDITEAIASLAYTYTSTKQHAKAEMHLRKLLKLMPNHAQTHINLANSLFEQKQYLEAITHYKAAINLEPKQVDAHINLGFTYRMLKKYDLAISYLHSALDLDKVNAKAFHVLGVIYLDIEDINRALHCLESATELSPDLTEYRVSFAHVLEKAKLYFEAGLQYHKACELNPNYLDSFILYGDYLAKMYRHDEALECYTRAAYLSPKNLDVFDKLGKTYLAMNDIDAATIQYKVALENQPKRLTSLLGLGQVYQELGDTAKGIEISDEIIAIDKSKPDGYLLKSRMKKSKPGDGLAEQLLQFTTNVSAEINDEAKCRTHFALGKIYDDQNNYADAFMHYSIGNHLKNKTLDYNAAADESKFSKLIAIYNAQLFKDFKHLGVESDMPVIIIGMPRSGTTLTEQIISSHKNIIGGGEVEFWGGAPDSIPFRLDTKTTYPECMSEINVKQANDIAKMYEALLLKIAGPNTNPKHITDKMPHNFLHIGLIALLFPNVKIIHTKRDPIDTCLSIFFQRFGNGHPYAFDLSNLGFHYKQYLRIMRHWHELLPGRIMDINYEDTIADPEYWSRKLIDHIGLEWDDACLAPHKLERTVKTASHWQVRQPIYKTSVQRWKNYEEFLQPLIEALK